MLVSQILRKSVQVHTRSTHRYLPTMDPEKNIYVNATSSADDYGSGQVDVDDRKKSAVGISEAADVYGDVETAERGSNRYGYQCPRAVD